MKIVLFTGSRADFGFLRHLASTIQDEPEIKQLFLVSGSHFEAVAGLTLGEIQASGFEFVQTSSVVPRAESTTYIANFLSNAVRENAKSLSEIAPDCVVVLGDRIEAMGLALAAHSLRIPIAHLHGGESTPMVLDEGYRNAITKLASVHFVSTNAHEENVLRLGEARERVFQVGALAVEAVRKTKLLSREVLSRLVPISFDRLLLFTFHPVTMFADMGVSELRESLHALRDLDEFSVCVTGSNLDGSVGTFRGLLEEFVAEAPEKRVMIPSLGNENYLNLMRLARVCVGNSSSGLLEAPIVGTPTVDIGSRQAGRFKPHSVISVTASRDEIIPAIRLASTDNFRSKSLNAGEIFGTGETSRSIVSELKLRFSNNTLLK